MPAPALPAHDPVQLTLFDAPAPGVAPAQPGPQGPQEPGRPRRGVAPPPAPGASADPAVPAPAAPPQGLSFSHPEAAREIVLAGHRVAYALRRARRRSIGFVVSAEGLAVSAPRWVGQGEVDQALQAKARWILRKLQEQRERAQRLQAARVDWRDGATVPFLGEPVILVLDGRSPGAVLHADAQALPGVPRLTLHLGLPQSAAPAQIRDAVQSWLQRQARRIFEERCAQVAPRLGVRMTRLTLSSASTRWGSASACGAIRLNWRLVHFALPVIDYVVTHELAHLREMNHSAAFWGVVREAMPDYERARQALRAEALPVFD
jgi:predicted metal-dependent hydrolase